MNPVRNKNLRSSGSSLASVSNGVKHPQGETAKIARRLKIIEGQVRGLSAMINKGTYCIDVIAQTSAVKQALSNVEDLLLESHLNGCVREQMASGQTGKAVKEVLKVYKLKRK